MGNIPRRFVSFVYWHDRIFGFTEDGDCWEFVPSWTDGSPQWRFMSSGPTGGGK
jgi:hypothetical protein